MSDNLLALMMVVPVLFLIGKFYYDAGKLLLRLVRRQAGRLPNPPLSGGDGPATPRQADGFPPYQP